DPYGDKRGCVVEDKHKDDDEQDRPTLAATGEPACADDGFACTDDVCTPSGCLRVPVDSRCVPADACTSARCMPDDPRHDETGCVPGPPTRDGTKCAEDGRACTEDVCRQGVCEHEVTGDGSSCAPIEEPFRHALALGSMTYGLSVEVGETLPDAGGALLARLSRIEESLDAAASTLPGEGNGGSLHTALATTAADTPLASDRAHIAFTQVLR